MASREQVSPRIAALTEELEAGNPDALDEFWDRLRVDGAPIVEAIDEEDAFRALTFVWRDGGEETTGIALEGGPASSPRDEDRLLTRLEGTDLWFKTYRVRADLRGHYAFSRIVQPDQTGSAEDPSERDGSTSMADPFNPKRISWPAYDANPEERDTEGSVIELRDAPAHTWTAPRAGVGVGEVEQHTYRSVTLGDERRVWLYHPVETVTEPSDDPAAMVLLDGWEWNVALPVAPTLDNLIAAGAIPPLFVVMPESLGHETRSRELPCHEPFCEFLAEELLPWAQERWGITASPARTIMAGQSFGGLASAFAGLRRPDVFGNVLSQSGSYWWKAETEFDIDAEWLVRAFATEPRVPVRFWLEVGLLEGHDMLASNRHMRDVLQAKGYDVTYREFNHDHWWPSWLGTLPDALQAITRDWVG